MSDAKHIRAVGKRVALMSRHARLTESLPSLQSDMNERLVA